MPLHPEVRWIVRNHSEMPFLANEGIALDWIPGYLRRGAEVMCDAPRAVEDVRALALAFGLHDRLVSYGPDYDPLHAAGPIAARARGYAFDVSCFGAVRPLKNHIAQALAAISFARAMRNGLRFHVSTSR